MSRPNFGVQSIRILSDNTVTRHELSHGETHSLRGYWKSSYRVAIREATTNRKSERLPRSCFPTRSRRDRRSLQLKTITEGSDI
jgi:hypothetical protein